MEIMFTMKFLNQSEPKDIFASGRVKDHRSILEARKSLSGKFKKMGRILSLGWVSVGKEATEYLLFRF